MAWQKWFSAFYKHFFSAIACHQLDQDFLLLQQQDWPFLWFIDWSILHMAKCGLILYFCNLLNYFFLLLDNHSWLLRVDNNIYLRQGSSLYFSSVVFLKISCSYLTWKISKSVIHLLQKIRNVESSYFSVLHIINHFCNFIKFRCILYAVKPSIQEWNC